MGAPCVGGRIVDVVTGVVVAAGSVVAGAAQPANNPTNNKEKKMDFEYNLCLGLSLRLRTRIRNCPMRVWHVLVRRRS